MAEEARQAQQAQQARQAQQRNEDAGRGAAHNRPARRDTIPKMAKARNPARRPFQADSSDDDSSSDTEHQGQGTRRALVPPAADARLPASTSARAGPAKPMDRLKLQADDFVLVESAQGGCSVARVTEVGDDSEHVRVRWYGPERARAAIPELARWLPMWLTGSGSSVAATYSRRGYNPDEHEVDRRRICYTFPDLQDDLTLPQPVLHFLQRGGATTKLSID